MMRTIRGSRLALLSACLLALTASSILAADEAPAAETGTISGKVVDTEGKAAAEATVNVYKNERPQQGQRPEPVATGKTGEDGSFKIEKVPVGKYRLMAMKRPGGRAMKADVEVTAGKDTAVGELKLEAGRGRGNGGAGGGNGGGNRGNGNGNGG